MTTRTLRAVFGAALAVLPPSLSAAGDLPAPRADHAEDAVFAGPMGVLRGHAEIGGVFETMIAEFAKPGASFTVGQTAFTENVAEFSWQAETASTVYEVTGDTFIVEDGRIVMQTLTLKAVPKY